MPAARGRAADSDSVEKSDERQKAVVVADIFCWREPLPGRPGEYAHMRAYANQTVRLTPDEFDRGMRLGGLAKPEDAVEVREAIEQAHGPVDDETMASMSASELIAYVTQNPDEQARVALFEQARDGGGRPEVLQAVGAGEQE